MDGPRQFACLLAKLSGIQARSRFVNSHLSNACFVQAAFFPRCLDSFRFFATPMTYAMRNRAASRLMVVIKLI